jgi:uncharacterized Zn finger protein
MGWYSRFPEYVSVAERKEKIAKKAEKLKKKKIDLNPVVVQGRALTKTFWGKAWCDNIESYKDFEYRLDRGRAYVRHGAVIDLKIKTGEVQALFCGTRMYTVKISIKPTLKKVWKALVKECSGKINSLIELLQGNFSQNVMQIITHPEKGLFPKPSEITFDCTCPDHAMMCKHVSAVLYGIGIRFDNSPDYLFVLRDLDHTELFAHAVNDISFVSGASSGSLAIDGDLSELFGVEIAHTPKKKLKTKKNTKASQVQKKSKKSPNAKDTKKMKKASID